jgi:hypothetical protein
LSIYHLVSERAQAEQPAEIKVKFSGAAHFLVPGRATVLLHSFSLYSVTAPLCVWECALRMSIYIAPQRRKEDFMLGVVQNCDLSPPICKPPLFCCCYQWCSNATRVAHELVITRRAHLMGIGNCVCVLPSFLIIFNRSLINLSVNYKQRRCVFPAAFFFI